MLKLSKVLKQLLKTCYMFFLHVFKLLDLNMINNLKRKKRNTLKKKTQFMLFIIPKSWKQNDQELGHEVVSSRSHPINMTVKRITLPGPHPKELACWGGTAFGIEVVHSKDMYSLLETSSDNSILPPPGLCILSLRKKKTTNIFKRLNRIQLVHLATSK